MVISDNGLNLIPVSLFLGAYYRGNGTESLKTAACDPGLFLKLFFIGDDCIGTASAVR